MYLCIDSASGKMSVETTKNKNKVVLFEPFEEDPKNRCHETFLCVQNFTVKISAHYGHGVYSKISMSDNDRILCKMSDLMHVGVNQDYTNPQRIGEILVSLSGKNSNEAINDWNLCLNFIANVFNQRNIWQINEAYCMVADLKKLMQEKESYVLAWNGKHPSPKTYKGNQLNAMKAQKLMDALCMLRECDLLELAVIKEEVQKMVLDFLPTALHCYLGKEVSIESDKYTVEQIQTEYDKLEQAELKKEEYIEWIIRNNRSKTRDNALAMFGRKYPTLKEILDKGNTIRRQYSEVVIASKQVKEECCYFEKFMDIAYSYLRDTGAIKQLFTMIGNGMK